jgi:hypothetical protein
MAVKLASCSKVTTLALLHCSLHPFIKGNPMNNINSPTKRVKYPEPTSQRIMNNRNDNTILLQPKIKPIPLFYDKAVTFFAKTIEAREPRPEVTLIRQTNSQPLVSSQNQWEHKHTEKQKQLNLQKKINAYSRTRNYHYSTITDAHLPLIRTNKNNFRQFKWSRKLNLAYTSNECFTLEQLSSGMNKRLLKLLKYCTCLQDVTIEANGIARLYLKPEQLVLMVRELVHSYKLLRFKLSYSLDEDMSSEQSHKVLKLLSTVRSVTK